MKRIILYISIAACMLASCSDNGNEPTDRNITLTNNVQLNQTVYADQISGASGVSFTTTAPWTSSITESATSRSAKAGIPDWITIDPASGNAAGDYNINITLGKNFTGQKRSATITISCNGQTISITITQDGVTATGEVPVALSKVKKINGAEVVYHETFYVKSIGSENYINKAYSAREWAYVSVESYTDVLGYKQDWICAFEYGNDRRLSSITQSWGSHSGTAESFYYWDGDKLSHIRGDQPGVSRDGFLRTDLEYSNTEYSLGNIDINWLLAASDYYSGLPVSAIEVNTSKTTRLLSKKSRVEESGYAKYDANFTYRYVFNEKGYITEIFETVNWVNGDSGEYLRYTFEY